MDRHNYPANEVRTIQLPSGRRVDVGYLDDTVVSIDERSPAFVGLEAEIEETVSELLHCGACDCTMVQPVEWDGFGPRHWRIELRCPNCESRCTTIVEDDVAEMCDRVHQRGAAELECELKRLAGQNAERQLRQLRFALENDLLLPEDF
jgi:hypothetical protein